MYRENQKTVDMENNIEYLMLLQKQIVLLSTY